MRVVFRRSVAGTGRAHTRSRTTIRGRRREPDVWRQRSSVPGPRSRRHHGGRQLRDEAAVVADRAMERQEPDRVSRTLACGHRAQCVRKQLGRPVLGFVFTNLSTYGSYGIAEHRTRFGQQRHVAHLPGLTSRATSLPGHRPPATRPVTASVRRAVRDPVRLLCGRRLSADRKVHGAGELLTVRISVRRSEQHASHF